MGIDYRIGGLIMGIRRSVFYTYIHESSTQDAPALRTRDGGLKIFMTSQLSPDIQCHRLSCIMIYTLLVSSTHTLGSFRGLGACKTVVGLRRLVFKGVCCDVIGMGCGSDLWFWESWVMHCV